MPTPWSSRGKAERARAPIVSENDNEKPDEKPAVSLDDRRGMSAQMQTDARRHQVGVLADQEALRQSQAALEQQLFVGPSATWNDAGEKAAYLLRLFAATGEAQDPRYKRLIEETIEDLDRLRRSPTKPGP